ncbi:MAG: TIGR01777 family oxidoreductase [Bacteroidota bacterium]
MKILITGGTGFIGSHLVHALTHDQHEVAILSRSKKSSNNPHLTYLQWNGKEMPLGIGLYDAVINLAGASIVDNKWNEEGKQLIIDSRKYATQACVEYINNNPSPPKVFLSASGVGHYGWDITEAVDESAPTGSDFPAQVVKIWEDEALKANCRTVLLRIGLVLGKNGGAMDKLLPLYKFYLGGKIGSGKQGFPWIHIGDIVGAIRFMLEHEAASGPVNLVGPEMVDQRTFSHALAKAAGTIDILPVPSFVMKMMLGSRANLLLGGKKVIPAKLKEFGYSFAYPELAGALADLV